jgi:hypothetical protein
MNHSLRLCLSISLLSLTLFAQGNGKGKGNANRNAQATSPAVAISVMFSDSDRRSIQQWAQSAPSSGLPPGLAKRGQLPPGLQKQLRRNGTLPPGLQKKISPFPQDLNARLVPLPAGCGCDRVFLDGKAMIIARASRAILDVISVF